MIYKVTLNGKIYEVEVEQGEAVIQAEYDAALPVATPAVAEAPVSAPQTPSAPTSAPAVGGGEGVKSPFPGNVNAVKVAPGQAVKEGDVLEIRFGSRVGRYRIVSVKEVVRKEGAADMYEVLEEDAQTRAERGEE